MPLHHHAVGQHSGLQVAADHPEQPPVPDPPLQTRHQHVVVHAVEELLQIHIHHPAPPRLDVPLRLTDRVVRPPPRPEAVAVFRKRRIEDRLQHLQDGLLDEPVEHGRDAQLPHSAPALRDLLPTHRRRPVASPEQFAPDSLPVLPQVRQQVIHTHPVDARTALVLPHALQRHLQVAALDHPLHQLHRAAASRALVSLRPRHGFTAPPYVRGFTPILRQQLHLHGLLVHGHSETQRRFALLSVRPFTGGAGPKRILHPVRLLRPLLTSRSARCFHRTSPFQVQGEISPGKNSDLPRTTAGSTQPEPWS